MASMEDAGLSGPPTGATTADHDLKRTLQARHIQMIAIGGAIGVGLFLGSGEAIAMAGPSLIVAYAFAGAMLMLMMRALGELILHRPVSGSFVVYAKEFIGPWAGYATGWAYWLMWVSIVMAEVTAIGIYVQYWWAGFPQWIPAIVALLLVLAGNLVAVRVFGELEFWFSMVKVVTILGLIVIGVFVLVTKAGDLGDTASLSNLWNDGGLFPTGLSGTLSALLVVVFAFLGVELVGVTAGETENPERSIPRAVRQITARILIFYIGTMLVIMALMPWDEISPTASPFVTVFSAVGIPAAGSIVTVVVIVSALSSANSGIFSCGRMLLNLSYHGHAPTRLRAVTSGVPRAGIWVSVIVMSLGVILNVIIPAEAFLAITSVAALAGLWTWSMIMFSHLGYRRRVRAGDLPEVSFRLPGSPWTNYVFLAFVAMTAIMAALSPAQRIAFPAAAVFAVGLAVGYWRLTARRTKLASAA